MDGSRLLALSTTQLWHTDAVRGPSTPSSPGISSQVAAPRFREGRLCPCRGDHGGAGWHRSQGLVVPGNMTLLALPPTARSSIRSSGFGTIYAATGSPTRYFVAQRTSRRMRVGLEPVRHRSPTDPLALRGPLGSGFARSVGGVCYQTAARSERHTFLSRKLRIFPESYESFPKVTKLHIKGHCIGETTGRG
jgi:hypothetical protein